MTRLLFAICLASFLSGYGVRLLHERWQQRQRSRYLDALAGRTPGWEELARDHEAAALQHSRDGLWFYAEQELEKASRVRALGQKVKR